MIIVAIVIYIQENNGSSLLIEQQFTNKIEAINFRDSLKGMKNIHSAILVYTGNGSPIYTK